MVKEVKITICPTRYAHGYKPLKNLPNDFIVARDSNTFNYGKDTNRGEKDGKSRKNKI